MPSEECRSCQVEIWWAQKSPLELNDNGLPKTIPVNTDSLDTPNGSIEVWTEKVIPSVDGGHAWVMHFRYLKKGEEPQPGHRRAVSHFATCAQADSWRRRPAAGKAGWPRGSNGEAANSGGGG